jgi:hypothetical protein
VKNWENPAAQKIPFFGEVSFKTCLFCAAGIFAHHELHPERSEGSGGIEIWETLCVNLSQPDVSLCSTWKLSVARRYLRGKRANFLRDIFQKNVSFALQRPLHHCDEFFMGNFCPSRTPS